MFAARFFECLEQGEIPETAPYHLFRQNDMVGLSRMQEEWRWRDTAISYGMWALVYKSWVCELARWIGDRRVLEIMAGRGWLAKALSEESVEVVATDDMTWDDRHTKSVNVFSVVRYEAAEAVRRLGAHADVLLVSWPPYGDDAVVAAVQAWGEGRPIVYVGEDYGGCNAPDSFFQHWREDGSAPVIDLAQWQGLHDTVNIGYYVEKPHHTCPVCGGWLYDNDWCSDSHSHPDDGGDDDYSTANL